MRTAIAVMCAALMAGCSSEKGIEAAVRELARACEGTMTAELKLGTYGHALKLKCDKVNFNAPSSKNDREPSRDPR